MPPNPFDDQPSQASTKLALTYGLLVVGNLAAWLWAWHAFADRPAMLGIALLAYVFGLRHAFDADHIAAIDNVVRKLMQQRKAPYAAGFFFSLGHSSIVVLASIAIAATATAFRGRLAALHEVGGMIGTFASASFLLIIGIANLFILRGVCNLVFPGTVQTLGDRMIASHGGILAGAAATIALGSILSIMGYEHLWNTTTTRHSAERASSATKRGARPRRKKA